MTKSSKGYAFKFAFLFSVASAVVFCAFIYFYISLAKEVEEIRTEGELYLQTKRIIDEMDGFDPKSGEKFYFPRYKTYKAGLFAGQKTVFSNLEFTPKLSQGYHTFMGKRYYVYELAKGRYFGADYLVVSKEFSTGEIYVRALLFLLLSLSLLFFVYLYLIRMFEKPLQRVNENLDRFIKDSIHEINTPLSIITTNVELSTMKNGEDKYLSRIKAAAKSLSNLYNDMEYLIKEERKIFSKEPINLCSAMRERGDYFVEIAGMKGIEIEQNLTDEDVMVLCDRTRLFRLIDNNISNAIKYSNENSKIILSVYKKDDKKAILSFRDFGIGIENPDMIFERYYREELSKGGFGLGLNIVRNICKEEGIEVSIVSKIGEGSEFLYILKLSHFELSPK